MLVGFALFALTLAVAARADMVILSFAAVGLVAGMSAGPIMSLPARVLEPSERAVGMGLYFTMFYAFTVAAPISAGIISSRWGTARGAFDFGVIMLIICFPAYWLFTRVTTVPTGRRKSDPSQVQA
jgi:MFS family permease